jgi:hypothetical protein
MMAISTNTTASAEELTKTQLRMQNDSERDMQGIMIVVCTGWLLISGAAYCVSHDSTERNVETIRKECVAIHDKKEPDFSDFYGTYCKDDGSVNEEAITKGMK